MPHTFTSPERSAVSGQSLDTYGRLELTDPDGTWVNFATLSSLDWVQSVTIKDSIDQNTTSFTAELVRDNASTLSLSPLREDSTLNRNAATTYAPLLDLHRQWRFSIAVVTSGTTVVAGDWKEVGKGYIDSIDVDDKRATITIAGRGQEAPLLDTEISEEAVYSVGTTDDLATVIQDLIDDNWDDSYGTVPTVYVPAAMDFIINEYTQSTMPLMQALQGLAETKGAVLRYRYDSAGLNRLTLCVPNREQTVEDWTIANTEYLSLPLNNLDLSNVRNYIVVNYTDEDGAVQTVTSPLSVGLSSSITSYGMRKMFIDLAEDTQITTEARAQDFADAVRADLEIPPLLQRFETFGFWFVQNCDYGRMTANGRQYDTDQYGGVTGFSHTWARGAIRSTVDLGGQPKGAYRKWRPAGQKRLPKPPLVPRPEPFMIPFPGDPATPGTGPVGTVNCEAWFRADDLLSTMSEAGEVLFWPDASGNARHALKTAPYTGGLFYTGVTTSGLPAVRYTRTAQSLNLTPSLINLTSGATFFLAYRFISPKVEHNNLVGFPDSSGVLGSDTRIINGWDGGSGDNNLYWVTGPGNVDIGNTELATWKILVIAIASPVSGTAYDNSLTATATFDPNNALDRTCRLMLGCDYLGTLNTSNSEIAEAILYSGVMTTALRTSVTNYLASKYSITLS